MKLIIFLLVVLFGTVNFYLNFWDYAESIDDNFSEPINQQDAIEKNISERMNSLDNIDQETIEIAFDDLVDCAKKRFNGEFAFPGQKLLKGKIFPSRGSTQLENGKMQLDIFLVDTIANGQKLGEVKFRIISDPDVYDSTIRETIMSYYDEGRYTEIERNNWLKIAYKRKYLDPQKNLVEVDWGRMCKIIAQRYIEVLAALYGPDKQNEKLLRTMALYAKAFEWVTDFNAFHYDKLGEKFDEQIIANFTVDLNAFNNFGENKHGKKTFEEVAADSIIDAKQLMKAQKEALPGIGKKEL